jgi:hypothetical protein
VKGFTGRVLAGLVATAAMFALAAPAQAAPPANDNLATATTIQSVLPQTTSGTLAEATIQGTDEPNHSGTPFPMVGSVWYAWTSPASPMKVKLSVCADMPTGPNPAVAVYRGDTITALTQDATSRLNCILKFTAAPSTPYKIVVYSISSATTSFQLALRQLNPPANDDFANAATIPANLPQTVNGTNLDATPEPSEPTISAGGPNASVWYEWTPLADVRAKIEQCDQLHEEPTNTPVVVYTGDTLGSLTKVADNIHSCRLQFDALGGTTYRIVVDTDSFVAEGPFQLDFRQLAPPSNDDLANAQVLPPGPLQNVTGTTVDATIESGEPNHFGPGCGPCPPSIGPPSSVWYSWTSDSSGGATTIDACDAIFLFSVAVYTGDSYPLTAAAPNNGACSQTFTASPSTTYKVAVASHNEDTFTLNPTTTPPEGNPGPSPGPTTQGPTGRRAKALKKCKKKHGKAHKKCVKRAKRLPV